VEALLPRLATISWSSVLRYGPDAETVAVVYSVPVVDGNGSFTYLELFTAPDSGAAIPMDRIFLGSRDGYAIDTISEDDNTITLHAREYQYPDCIANPTKHVNIVVKWSDHHVVLVSTFVPDDQPGSDKQGNAPNQHPQPVPAPGSGR
jgi:hypothetical protein